MAKKRTNWAGRTFTLILGLFGIFVVLFAMNMVFAAPAQKQDQSTQVVGSSYSDAASGQSLYYRLLQKFGFNVSQNRHPFEARSIDGPNVDIIWHVNSYNVVMSPDEVDWVDTWVDRGGTLVLINNPDIPSAASIEPEKSTIEDPLLLHWLDELQLSPHLSRVEHISASSGRPTRRVPVNGKRMPTPLGRLGIVSTYEKRSLIGPLVFRFARNETSKEDHGVINDSHGIVLAKVQQGEGTVWLVSDPYLFSNLLIQEADNAPLAVTLALSTKKGRQANILFDEYHLGFVQSITLADAARTPVGRAILYFGAIVVLALGTAGARFGRVRKGLVPIGVSQRSFVTALAELWLAGNAYSVAADALWKRYRTRSSVRRKGIDLEMDKLRKGNPKAEDLLDISKKLDL